MKFLLLKSGLQEKSFDRLLAFVKDHAEPHELQQIEGLLNIIHAGAWARANQVWKYVPPDQWERYDLLKVTGLTEQTLLKEALSVLKINFRKRMDKWLERARAKARKVTKDVSKEAVN